MAIFAARCSCHDDHGPPGQRHNRTTLCFRFAFRVQALWPKIAELWHELYIPLAYRSRFLQNFRHRETIYLEMEFRRLQWRASAVRTHGHAHARSVHVHVLAAGR